MKAKQNSIYMLVTNDKYELPIVIADTLAELANKIGVRKNVISSAISHAKKKGFKSVYVKVNVD